MALVDLARDWATRKGAKPGQIALAWLLAQGDDIVPIPGTTQTPHLRENAAARQVAFTKSELSEFTAALDAIEVRGALGDGIGHRPRRLLRVDDFRIDEGSPIAGTAAKDNQGKAS